MTELPDWMAEGALDYRTRALNAESEVQRLQAEIEYHKWQPIETIPQEGKFLVAKYEPTSWEYWVTTVRLYADDVPRRREILLTYARAWQPLPAPPKKETK